MDIFCSTRVSNELGAGRPQAARIAVYTVMILAIIEVLIASGTLFGTRDIFGYSFSNQKEVVGYGVFAYAVALVFKINCINIMFGNIKK